MTTCRSRRCRSADPGLHFKGRILNTSKYPVAWAACCPLYLPLDKWANGDGYKQFLAESNVTLHPQVLVDREWGRDRRFRTALNLGVLVRFGSTGFTDYGKPSVLKMEKRHVVELLLSRRQHDDVVFDHVAVRGLWHGPVASPGHPADLRHRRLVEHHQQVRRPARRVLRLPRHDRQQGCLPAGGRRRGQAVPGKKSFLLLRAGGGVYGISDSGKQTGGSQWRAFLASSSSRWSVTATATASRTTSTSAPMIRKTSMASKTKTAVPSPTTIATASSTSMTSARTSPRPRTASRMKTAAPDSVESDRDGDGIPDNIDKCPDDPEDRDGFEDEDGCPDPDNDKDGILDVDDLCPNDPEDIDGFEDKDGCPDPDNDKDRILDKDDKCPNEPEVYNGFEDEDGCPDKGRVILRRGKLEILDKVAFRDR